MATQARAVLKIPARIVGTGNVTVTLENGIFTIHGTGQGAKSVNSQIGTEYTIASSDMHKIITFDNSAPITVRVPTGLPMGFTATLIQIGLGPVTVVGEGTTVNAAGGVTTFGVQYTAAELYSYAPNTFLLSIHGEVVAEEGTVYNVSSAFAGAGAMFSDGEPIEPPTVASVTSAGVFDSSGRLVRTLWSAEINHPDLTNPVAAWDGTLDTYPPGTLSIAPTGDYTIKLIWHEMEYQWDGVVGNTSPDHSNNMIYHNEGSFISDMEITAAGEMYYVSGYNERWPVCNYTTTANPQVMNYPVFVGFRTAYSSGHRCCTDGTLVYYGHSPHGVNQCIVYGIQCSDKTIWPFSSGVVFNEFTHAIAINSTNKDIASLAVNVTGSFLFVAASSLDSIRVFNKTTGAEVSSHVGTWNAPTALAVDPTSGTVLWMAYSPGGVLVDTIIKLNVSGGGVLSASATTITVPSGNIVSIAVSPDGATLLAVDAGVAQQVRAFNTSDGSVKSAFGTSGRFGADTGYASTPVVSNTRFMFKDKSHFGGSSGWIAYAPDASWWLGDCGNERALHFTSGNSPTYVEQIAYNGGFYSTVVDRTDPTRVTVNFLEYQVDYDFDTITPTNGSWTLLNNWGHSFENVQTQAYQRLRFLGTYSNGRRYACMNDAAPPYDVRVYELTSSGVRDTGATFGLGYYLDANMDRYFTFFVGSSAADWEIRVSKTPFTGFDVNHNPTWGAVGIFFDSNVLDLATFPPPELDPNFKVQTEGTSNGVLPIVQSFGDPSGGNDYGRVGGLDMTTGAIRYDTYQVVPITQNNQLTLMYPEAPFMPRHGLGGGSYFYKPGHNNFFTTFRGENWGNNQASVFDHWHESGLLLKRFGKAAPYFGAESLRFPEGHQDTPAVGAGTVGIPNSYFSFKGMEGLSGNMGWGDVAYTNGVYYIYVNDEWYHGGLARWSVRGADTIHEQNFSVSWNSASYVAPSDPNNLLLGLPYGQSNLVNGTAGWTRSPAADTAYPPTLWQVNTNAITANPHSDRDLAVYYAGEGACTINRAIPRVGSGNWSIDAMVFFAVGFAANSELMIEVLDNTNKVIVVIKSNRVSTTDAGLFVNGTKISTETGFEQDWKTLCGAVRPLLIEANTGTGLLTVTYNEDIIASGVAVFEGGAAIASPAKFQIRASGPPGSTNSPAIVITRLNYDEA